MPSSRQLVAIMFTDIVGYTALMGEDEKRAFELLKKNRELQKPIIEQFHGRWIKELGDGVLASFNTITDAVHAAIKIQDDCNASSEFLLRIGIHLGEVVFEDDDVFGDGVNIASRIQAIAKPGGIYISEAVHHNVTNKHDITTQFVKQEMLKNVREPVRIYEIVTASTTETFRSSIKELPKKSQEKSIAVLPFVNMSNDPDQEYFGDGMAEEILNSLAHLKDLKVAGRTSSFQFKGKNIDLKEVAEKLNVKTVLEGSIRKQGNRLRITAQLIDVEDGFHIWSERYDRNTDDIFDIQDEIALAITEQLKITLLEDDVEKITKLYTQNAEAYEYYLKGRFNINRRGSSILKGLEFFKKAIVLDPEFALAYTGYADANLYSAFYNFLPAKEVSLKAKNAAETAIKLDSSIAEAYCSMALYNTNFEWNWIEARKNFLRAIEINPKYAQAHSFYGLILFGWIEGKFDEAEKQGQIAIKLEPLSAIDHGDLCWTVYGAGKFEEALAIAKTGIELDANSFLSWRVAGLCHLALNRYEEAIHTFDYLMNISNRHQHAINCLIWARCANQDFPEARTLMDELEKRSASEYIGPTHFGISAAYLGDMDLAINYLEKAFNDRDPIIVQMKQIHFVPPALRNDSRFQKILDRVGFPE